MGYIKIQDTGYIKPTNEGTQASAANRANSGSVIILNTARFIPSLKRNMDASPELGSTTPSEVNLGSIENMNFQLICAIDMNNDTDTARIPALLDLVMTNGYKLMWYDYTSATPEKNNGKLIYRIATNSKIGHQTTNGEKSAFTITDNFYHLHVVFSDIQPSHTATGSIMNYTLTGKVMKVETSLI